MTADEFVGRLQGVTGRGPRWRAICPAHETRHDTRTLSVLDAGDGRILVKCFANCTIDAICGALAIDLSDLFPPRETFKGDDKRPPKIRKPWTPRDCAVALEIPLTSAFLLLAKVGAGGRLSAAELKEATRCSQTCVALLDEMREL